jgi:hypothetical protein
LFTCRVHESVQQQRRPGKKRQRRTAAYVFRVHPNVPNEAVPYNPLGIAIAYLRSDQGFE